MAGDEEIGIAVAQHRLSGELALVIPVVEPILQGLENAVRNRVFQKLNSGEALPPQEALNSWIELHSYHRLRKRLTQGVNSGHSAGKVLEPMWEQLKEERDDGEE